MRLIGSFRARIFAVSALIVVAVLAGVVALGWSRVLGYEMQRLDDRLCGEVRRLVTLPPLRGPDGGRGLSRMDDDLVPKLRLRGPEQLLWSLEREVDGPPPLRSAAWPAGLDTAALAWAPDPAGPGQPGRGGTGSAPARGDGRPFDAGPGAEPPDGPPDEMRRGPPGEFRPGPGPRDGPPDRRRGGRPPPLLCELATFQQGGSTWRAARSAPRWASGFVAADVAAVRADMLGALQRAAGLALPLALALTAAGAWLLSGLALRPVTRLREAMKTVDAGALDQRLPSEREDREFRALIGSYNTMLDRLEASFHQASRFSADAAHELKTPLTILRGQLERAIQSSEHRAIQQQLGAMQGEVGRLVSITRKLLLLSQADAGRLTLRPEPVDLAAMLADCVADAQMAAPGLALQADVPAALTVSGDAQLLAQLLNNLCSNALKYTSPDGHVRISAAVLADAVEVRFENSAPGLQPADRMRFFERFYRGDAAHSRQVDGHGLGLSLARVIARAHGGDLVLEEGQPADDRVVLCLRLPRAAGG